MATTPHGITFDPARIGLLLDWPVGEPANLIEPITLAFEEAAAAKRLPRAIELVVETAHGLPLHSADRAIAGYKRLVEAGCVGVIGPLISDNAIALAPVVDAVGVPAVSWCGTERFHGSSCFVLGNGGCGEEGQLMAAWLAREGHRRIGVLNELSPNGEEYLQYFRWGCRDRGLSIVRLETITQMPETLEASVMALRDARADALAYIGFGYPTVLLGPIFAKLGWTPPRIMTTAIQFCYNKPEWMAALEGWVGIDQYCEDNPLVEPFLDRFERRFGRRPHTNTVLPLSYDSARVFVEALVRAPILTGPGVRQGLERVRFLPSVTGGPRTHIAGGPHDHKLFKGDWLLYRRVERGRTVFVDTFDATA
jgi:ABC-type branched-subunit amino acid transport system substrate-binding protein